jgi:fibronectin type 3 domain-containing protein
VATDVGKAILAWTAPASAVRGYHVYRARADQPWKTQFERIATVTGTTCEDHGLAAGAVYYYTVRAVSPDGVESRPSFRARTQPRVLLKPVVSVLAADRVEVTWNTHPARDIVGYNVYRGAASVRTVKKGTPAPWKDNDPEYAEPLPVEVRDITHIRKLNDQPLPGTTWVDHIDLTRKGVEAADYRYAVYAYIIKAVNRLGTESGPSPYALTIPSEPADVRNREAEGMAELRWNANLEKGVAGYRVYKLEGTWNIVRLTDALVQTTTFSHNGGKNPTRYWVVAVDALGQEGQPSSPVWHNHSYRGFFEGEWHQ